jgi:hypothetical protein
MIISTQVPKILLIVGGNPIGNDAGAIFLKEICSRYPKPFLSLFFLPRLETYWNLPEEWLGIKVNYSCHPLDQLNVPLLKHSVLFNDLLQIVGKYIQIPQIIGKLVKIIEKEHIQKVWFVLNSPSMIFLAGEFIKIKKISMICTVWDPPERFIADLNFNEQKANKLLDIFGLILKSSEMVGVASENMQIEYEQRYGISSIRQIHGLDESLWRIPTQNQVESEEFIIGFAGNMYATTEYSALLSALDEVNWKIDGKHISIWFIGKDKPNNSRDDQSIQYFGWRSLSETLELLSQTDITYVPYWFDDSYSITTRLCFPNKISTYLAAGKPILYHGPGSGSPAKLMDRYPIGLCCNSLESEKIISCIRRFIIDQTLYQNATMYGQKALMEEFNLKVFLQRFSELVGIEENVMIMFKNNE